MFVTEAGQHDALLRAQQRRAAQTHKGQVHGNGGNGSTHKAIIRVTDALKELQPGNWEHTHGGAGTNINYNGVPVCIVTSNLHVLTAGAMSTKIRLKNSEDDGFVDPKIVAGQIEKLIPPAAILLNNLNAFGLGEWSITFDDRSTQIRNNGNTLFLLKGNSISAPYSKTPFVELSADRSNLDQIGTQLAVLKVLNDSVDSANTLSRGWTFTPGINGSETTISFGGNPVFALDADTNIVKITDRSKIGAQIRTNEGAFADPENVALVLDENKPKVQTSGSPRARFDEGIRRFLPYRIIPTQ